MKKKVTIKEIANKAGVSLSTVNKALTGKKGVSEKRRGEIIALAKEMGYVVNRVAQTLSRKPVKIGVIIPADWQQYFGAIKHGMHIEFDRLFQSNVEGKFFPVKNSNDIDTAVKMFGSSNYDGIIYCPSLLQISDKTKKRIQNNNIPVFFAGDECCEISGMCTISVNSTLSGEMAADFLKLLLPEGANVAVFTGSLKLNAHAEKAKAFKVHALKNELTYLGVFENYDSYQKTLECITKLYNETSDVDGIYVATAMVAPIIEFVKKLPPEKRPVIIATDVYHDVRSGMEQGMIKATISQNQVLTGRLAVKMVYSYIVEKLSYNGSSEEFSKHISVNPHIFFKSNIDSLLLDDGNDYICK